MSDLIERLRGRANGFQRRHGGTDGLDYYSVRDAQLEIEAADALAERDAEIERLTREIVDAEEQVEAMWEALAPFACTNPHNPPGGVNADQWKRNVDRAYAVVERLNIKGSAS